MLKTTGSPWVRLIAFAVGVTCMTACSKSQGGMKLGDDEYTVIPVASTQSHQTISYPATITCTQHTVIRPQVSGFLV